MYKICHKAGDPDNTELTISELSVLMGELSALYSEISAEYPRSKERATQITAKKNAVIRKMGIVRVVLRQKVDDVCFLETTVNPDAEGPFLKIEKL